MCKKMRKDGERAKPGNCGDGLSKEWLRREERVSMWTSPQSTMIKTKMITPSIGSRSSLREWPMRRSLSGWTLLISMLLSDLFLRPCLLEGGHQGQNRLPIALLLIQLLLLGARSWRWTLSAFCQRVMCTFDKEFICIEEDSVFSAKFEQSLLQYIDKKSLTCRVARISLHPSHISWLPLCSQLNRGKRPLRGGFAQTKTMARK